MTSSPDAATGHAHHCQGNLLNLIQRGLGALEDGKPIPVAILDELPPWQAARLARLAQRLYGSCACETYTVEQVVAAATAAGGAAGPGWLTGRPSFTCGRCHRTTHHPLDVADGYCPGCHARTGPSDTSYAGCCAWCCEQRPRPAAAQAEPRTVNLMQVTRYEVGGDGAVVSGHG